MITFSTQLRKSIRSPPPPPPKRPLGRHGTRLTMVGFGAGPLGDVYGALDERTAGRVGVSVLPVRRNPLGVSRRAWGVGVGPQFLCDAERICRTPGALFGRAGGQHRCGPWRERFSLAHSYYFSQQIHIYTELLPRFCINESPTIFCFSIVRTAPRLANRRTICIDISPIKQIHNLIPTKKSGIVPMTC